MTSFCQQQVNLVCGWLWGAYCGERESVLCTEKARGKSEGNFGKHFSIKNSDSLVTSKSYVCVAKYMLWYIISTLPKLNIYEMACYGFPPFILQIICSSQHGTIVVDMSPIGTSLQLT